VCDTTDRRKEDHEREREKRSVTVPANANVMGRGGQGGDKAAMWRVGGVTRPRTCPDCRVTRVARSAFHRRRL
jgi:hypothetical protein